MALAFSNPDLIRGAMDPLQDPTVDPNWGALTAAAQPPMAVGPQAIRQAMSPYAGPYSAGPMAAEDQAAKLQQANQAWDSGGGQLPQHTGAAVQQLMSQTNDPSLVKQAQDLLAIGPQTYAHDYQVAQFLLQRGAQQQMQQAQQRAVQEQTKQAQDRAQYHQVAMDNEARARNSSYLGVPGVNAGAISSSDDPNDPALQNPKQVLIGPGLTANNLPQGASPDDLRNQMKANISGLPAQTIGQMIVGNPLNDVAGSAYGPAKTRDEQYAQAQKSQDFQNSLALLPLAHPAPAGKAPTVGKPPGLSVWEEQDRKLGQQIDTLTALTRGKTPDVYVSFKGKDQPVSDLRKSLNSLQQQRVPYNVWAAQRQAAGDPAFAGGLVPFQPGSPAAPQGGAVPVSANPAPASPVAQGANSLGTPAQMDALANLTPDQVRKLQTYAQGTDRRAAQARAALATYNRRWGIQ